MKLQMVDVVGQYQHIKTEVDAAVQRVLESGQFILGKDVAEFEAAAAAYLGSKHALGCASGTDALQIAMMALGIGPGDEVISTPFTFVATAETIAIIGAKPVYVDIDPKTYNIDPAAIRKAITPRTKAIIPVHLYGQSADMDVIMKIAREHGLRVIEDACQAIGATFEGKKICTFGDVGCLSFFPSKNRTAGTPPSPWPARPRRDRPHRGGCTRWPPPAPGRPQNRSAGRASAAHRPGR